MKILFIACYSPFINNSAAIETLQYLNKLSEVKENKVHLLTVDFPENSIYYDSSLRDMINKDIKIHLIKGGKIFNKLVPRKGAESEKPKTESTKNIKKMKFLRSIKNAVVIPDMYYSWAKKAGKYGIELMKKENFDLIFSMHEPPSSHLCGYYIKKENKNIPWITYWSDPWLKDSTREKSFFIKKWIEKSMEKKVVENADKFIFVTEANRQDYINTYKIDKNKTFIITRGFDEELFERLSKEEKPKLIEENKINIIYAGEIFSKLRDIKPFIKALENISKENPDLYKKINLMFFGNIDDSEAKRDLDALEISKVNKRIPFEEALKYMLNSEVLLIFGNKNSKQIPAKIYEYFGAKGKIFVIYGDENDPIKKLVENHTRCKSTLNNEEDIKNSLIEILETPKEALLGEDDYNFEWKTITKRLTNIFNK